jgi:phosphatidylglycerophosphate synthase
MFSKNVGTADRVLRAVAGLALIALVFVGPQTPWGWLGLILVGTALVGFCPAYRLIGLRTCPVQSREA